MQYKVQNYLVQNCSEEERTIIFLYMIWMKKELHITKRKLTQYLKQGRIRP